MGDSSMNQRILELTAKEKRLRSELDSVVDEIAITRSRCDHKWSNPVHVPDTRKTVTLKHPDPEMERSLHMGGHPPTSFVTGNEAHWRRTCEVCGMEQETTKKKTATAPDFG